MGGLSSALSFIPGLGVVGDIASTMGSKIFGSMSADDQWSKEAGFNANQAQINRDFQRSERLASQEFNLDMWNRSNAYNSPAQQLERAKAAGINPNAAIEGMSSGSSSPVTTSPMSGSMASAPGSLAASMLLQDATISNLMANTRKANAEADNSTYELTWNKMTETQRYDSLVNMNDKTKQEISKLFRETAHIDFDESMQEATFRWFSRKSEEEINVMMEQLNLLRNQSAEVIANIDLKNSETRLNNEKRTTEVFNQRKIASDIVYTDNMSEKVEAETTGIQIDNDLKSLELEFSNVTGIPSGTPESEALFFLWCSGRFDDFLTCVSFQADDALTTLDKRTLFSNTVEIADDNQSFSSGYNWFRQSPPYLRTYNNRKGLFNPYSKKYNR